MLNIRIFTIDNWLLYILSSSEPKAYWWACSIAMVRRPHFQTWISLRPVGQSCSNFICSIMWKRLHYVLGKIGSKLGRVQFWVSSENSFWSWLALERRKLFPYTCSLNGKIVVSTIAPSLLIGSSSNLKVTRTAIKSRTSSNFGQIGQFTSELLAIECRKTQYSILSGA